MSEPEQKLCDVMCSRGSLLIKVYEKTCIVTKRMLKCAPDGGFREAFAWLTLPENVKVSAGTEIGQQTRPFRRIQRRVKRR